MRDPENFDVVHALAPVRGRLGRGRVLRATLLGLGTGAGVGTAILLLARLLSLTGGPVAGLAALIIGGIVGLAVGIRRWPATLEAAQIADGHFSLHDRLTTALEFRSSPAALPTLQRADVAQSIRDLPLRRSAHIRPGIREGGLAGAGIIALVLALLLVGSPATSRSTQAATGASRQIHRVSAKGVPAIVRKLEKGLTPQQRKDAGLRKLEAALARLRRRLAHADTRTAALRAISATQQQLQKIAASLHPVNQQAVTHLNQALSHYMTAQQRAAAAAGKSQALAVAAQALQRLAKNLAHLSPAQRAQLARTLAKAANASSDSKLRGALHQAASSLAYNDPQTAAASLQQAAGSLSNTPAAQQAQARAQSAGSQLDSLKNQVSGVNSSSGSPGKDTGTPSNSSGQGQQGGSTGQGQGAGQGNGKGSGGKGQGSAKGSGNGKGQGSGQGQGQGNGSGKGNGNGKGSGQGKGQGQGQGSGSGGQGGSGGHGIGGGRGNAGGKGQGRFATVYSPRARQGTGPHSVQSGPAGAPQQGPIVPYQQVIGQYSSAAHSALDRANLPPTLRSYVRSYFSAVSR
jgi:hypothetical protein